MEINIYQINVDRDEKRIAFESLDRLERYQGSKEINNSLYDKVYEGEVDCKGLEDVFRMFNMDRPPDFRGWSMSVSDIVEVVESDSVEPGFYFCDSFGFEKVDFDPEAAQERLPDTIRVVFLEPGKTADIKEIGSSLEDMQAIVGGNIEAYYPFEEEVCIVCNEEGKIEGLPLNRAIREEEREVEMTYGELVSTFREFERQGNGTHLTGYVVISEDSFNESYPVESRTYAISSNNKAFLPNMGGYSIYASSVDGSDPMVRLERYLAEEKGGSNGWKIERCYMKEQGKEIQDIIAGTCFICDCSGSGFGSLNDEQLKRYQEKYRYPESFFKINDRIEAIPIKSNSKTKER